MYYFYHLISRFGKRRNGYTQKQESMGTIVSVFFKSTFAAFIPFFLLAVGLATLQLWALGASIFSATLIGLFHLYKIARMVSDDLKAGKKVFPSFKKRIK